MLHGAPEVISGKTGISVSTDIFQLGCTAYRLANGIDELSFSAIATKEELIKDISNQENWNVINDKIGGRFLPRINLPYIPIGGGYGGRPSTPPRRTYHKSYYRRKR